MVASSSIQVEQLALDSNLLNFEFDRIKSTAIRA
jgi:hypothetical protein